MADEHELARELESTTDDAKLVVGKIEFGRTEEDEQRLDNLLLKQPKGDDIDGPSHYNGYEVLECINNSEVGFEIGNVIKYCARSKKKGKELRDLQKAQFYLDWYVRRLEKE